MAAPGRIAEADCHQGSHRQPRRERGEQVRLFRGQPLGVIDDQEHGRLRRQGHDQPFDRAHECSALFGVTGTLGHDLGVRLEGEQWVQPGAHAGRCAGGELPGGGTAGEGRGQGGVRHGGVAAPDQHGGAVLGRQVGQLGRESRLAHPRGPTHRDQPPTPVACVLPGRRRRPEPGLAADHGGPPERREHRIGGLPGEGCPRRGWAGADLGDRGGGVDREQQCRVLAEHRRLEGLEVGAGIEAQLLAEALLGLRVRRQRVDLPARAVQRQHQLPAQPLVEGVGRDQLLQPPHDLAMLPEGEGGGHGGLLRDHAKLPEPGDGGVGEVRRSEVAEHVAAPEGEGFVQKRGGVGGVADPERLLCAVHQSREDLGIEVGRCQRQKVPTGPGAERVTGTCGCQYPTHRTDVAP